jgi:hypothetical protein
MSVGENTWDFVMKFVMNYMMDSERGVAALLGSTQPQPGIIERVSKEFRGFFQTKSAFFFFYLDRMELKVGIEGLDPLMDRSVCSPDVRMKFLLTRETHYRKYLMILHLLAPDVDRTFNEQMTTLLEAARVKFLDHVQCEKYGFEMWNLELSIKRFHSKLRYNSESLELPWSTESIESRYYKSELILLWEGGLIEE